jgi:hypothetical protein
MPDPVDALVSFFESYSQAGLGSDGLPLFKTVIMIRKAKPPRLEVEALATEEDFEQFHEAYRLFERQRGARSPTVDGYPLALWPVVSPADLKTLAARDIVTVEQLAALAAKKGGNIPAPIVELAARAKQLVALQKETGRYEIIINDLTQQRDALVEQLREAGATIAAQNVMISQLRQMPGSPMPAGGAAVNAA